MGRQNSSRQSSTSAWSDCKFATPILVVQRNDLLGRSLARYLSAHYSSVHVAKSPSEAERHLRAQPTASWHIVCGHSFAAGELDGIQALRAWRSRFPTISRAILATGADLDRPCPPEVDGVFQKPSDPHTLLQLLSFHHHENPPFAIEQNSENPMKNPTPKLHDLKTLKERVSAQAATKPNTAQVSTARGFTAV